MTDFDIILDHILQITKIVLLIVIVLFTIRTMYNLKFGKMVAGMHSADDAKNSWMRISGSIIMFSALGIAFYQVYLGKTVQENLILGMLGIAIMGKVGQGFSEKSNKNNSL